MEDPKDSDLVTIDFEQPAIVEGVRRLHLIIEECQELLGEIEWVRSLPAQNPGTEERIAKIIANLFHLAGIEEIKADRKLLH